MLLSLEKGVYNEICGVSGDTPRSQHWLRRILSETKFLRSRNNACKKKTCSQTMGMCQTDQWKLCLADDRDMRMYLRTDAWWTNGI